ncbi:hypothetical protein ACL02T_33040 [Pseudonocardia sp. RS010]|uniref:hypothetical protein n=1 Tax=Pseudonocardia sp. RS010 TaxID=3385979 RepID=UPI0039A3BA86
MPDQLDLIPDPAPARGLCRWCSTSLPLPSGLVAPHDTPCPCQHGHPPGRRCPFLTTCPGSNREPRTDV